MSLVYSTRVLVLIRVVKRFAAGKGTALVIDIGKSVASVVPVSDGFVLRKGMNRVHISRDLYVRMVLARHRTISPPSSRPNNRFHNPLHWEP